jgi:hypothetical protein
MEPDRFKAVWGAAAIAVKIDRTPRQTFYMPERGLIPARRIGAIWQSTEGELHDFKLGIIRPPKRAGWRER